MACPPPKLKHTSTQIAQNGYAVYCIQDPNPKRVFGYTVGLTRLGQPEFLVRGISEEDTLIMLNGWHARCCAANTTTTATPRIGRTGG
ncbi:DUF4262 domain-containing protein [Arthrobacter sp. JCM 19049]|uniref:DUF4262 domain-containing protein n=1 Tax=Arthrobacter sp. JCM 19049 TaxID=1460643 RepID=UPI0006D103DA|nr:DUF4262 domain-containing protein [Arthrobacter sp. JCM 19049]